MAAEGTAVAFDRARDSGGGDMVGGSGEGLGGAVERGCKGRCGGITAFDTDGNYQGCQVDDSSSLL